MKKYKVLIVNCFTLFSLTLVYCITNYVLSFFGLTLTPYVTYSLLAISFLLLLILVIRIIVLLFQFAFGKGNLIARILSCVSALCIFMALFPSFFFLSLYVPENYQPVHIVEKEGKTMIAVVEKQSKVRISYYDYKFIFIQSNQVKIKEDCGKGRYDPFKVGITPKVYKATYYDDNGNAIKMFDHCNELLTDTE